MADDEKEGEATQSRGGDWEVVSLTASTYAAAPGPKGVDPTDEHKDKEFDKNESQSSGALFMSDHFVFPPSQHENLPIEPELSEIYSEAEAQKENITNVDSEPNKMGEKDVQSKSDDAQHGIQYGIEYEESKRLQKLNLVGEEQGMYVDPGFSSFHTDGSKSVPHTDEQTEFYEHSPQNLDSPPGYAKKNKEDRFDESSLPCEAWWKRHAASLYRHAKEANTFWSVCVAAALMGLAILGQRWRREKWQLDHLKLRFNLNDERVSRMLKPIGRFKVSGHQRFIRDGGASTSL